MRFKKLDAIHIHPPKTGGTTIRYELLRQLEPELHKALGGKFVLKMLQHPEYNPVKRRARKSHSTAMEWIEAIGEHEFSTMWSFGFIRNPFDQIRSLFKQLTYMDVKINDRFEPYMTMTWEEFVMGDGPHSMVGNHELIDQRSYFVNESGRVLVDDIYVFDNYSRSVVEISRKLGVLINQKRKWRKTDKGEFAYTPEMIEKVMDNYGSTYEFYKQVKFQKQLI